VPSFDQLVSASQRPDVPHDERIDTNAEVLNQFIKSLEFPDREEVESYLPTLTKASYLEPFFEQYVAGNRRTPTHTAILYLKGSERDTHPSAEPAQHDDTASMSTRGVGRRVMTLAGRPARQLSGAPRTRIGRTGPRAEGP